MAMAPNPLSGVSPADLRFSAHAQFRLDGTAVDPGLVDRLVPSAEADVSINAESGYYVFRSGEPIVVVRRDADGRFAILSIMDRAQFPV